jgi:hypothetical protein
MLNSSTNLGKQIRRHILKRNHKILSCKPNIKTVDANGTVLLTKFFMLP